MKKILALLVLILTGSVAFGQFSPTFDTVRLIRGGKVYQVITYGQDSVKINGVTYNFTGAGLWQTAGGQAIQPDPISKIIKYPNPPVNLGNTVPAAYRPMYWDSNTGYLSITQGTAGGGGSDPIDAGDTLTGCNGVYVVNKPAEDVAINVDSIANICGCFVVKNIGPGSTVTITSIEGLQFDSLGTSVVLEYNEWASICADSTFFVTLGTNDLAVKNSQWPLYYDADTLKVNKASASDSGYLTAADWNTFNGKEKKRNVIFVSKHNTDADYSELATVLNLKIPNVTIIVDALDSTDAPYLTCTVEKPGTHIIGLGTCYYDPATRTVKGHGARIENKIQVKWYAKGCTIENITVQQTTTAGSNGIVGNASDFKVKDCIVVGIMPTNGHNTGHGIQFTAANYPYQIRGFLASNCKVYNLYHGFVVKGSDANLVNCYSENCYLNGIVIKGGQHGIHINNVNISNYISKTTIGDTTQYGIHIFSMEGNSRVVENINLSNINISNVRYAGIYVNATDTSIIKHVNISNVTVDTAGIAGVYFDTINGAGKGTINDVKITNGSFSHTPYGISNPSVVSADVFYSSCKGGTSSVAHGYVSTYGTGGGSGTVTSIATTSPLTGGPITTTGTVAIHLDTLTLWRTKQNQGAVAHGWGNHASAGYMSNPMTNTGDMITLNGDGNAIRLPVGLAGQLLRVKSGTLGTSDPSMEWVASVAQDSTNNPWIYSAGQTIQRGTGNVGIGTTTPTLAALQVQTTQTVPFMVSSDKATITYDSVLYVTNRGWVGIGTTAPSYQLQTTGNVFFGDKVYSTNATTGSYFDNTGFTILNGTGKLNTEDNCVIAIDYNNDDADTRYFEVGKNSASSPTSLMRLTETGNLGIGTTAPNTKLHVESSAANDTAARFRATGTGNAYGVSGWGSLTGLYGYGVTGNGVIGTGAVAGVRGNGGLFGLFGAGGSTAAVRGESTAGNGVEGYTTAATKWGGYFLAGKPGRGLWASSATVDTNLIVNRGLGVGTTDVSTYMVNVVGSTNNSYTIGVTNNSTQTGAAQGVTSVVGGTHTGNSMAFYGNAVGGSQTNYSFWGEAGIMMNKAPIRIDTTGANVQLSGANGIRLYGNATVWDDVAFPSTQLKQVGQASKPDYDNAEMGYLFPYDSTEVIGITVKMPHWWKEGSAIYPHIHWYSSSGSNDSVVWRLSYRVLSPCSSGALNWTTISHHHNACAYSGENTTHRMAVFPAIDMTGQTISALIDIKIWRKQGVGDNADVLFKMFDIHCEKDAMGSSTETTK